MTARLLTQNSAASAAATAACRHDIAAGIVIRMDALPKIRRRYGQALRIVNDADRASSRPEAQSGRDDDGMLLPPADRVRLGPPTGIKTALPVSTEIASMCPTLSLPDANLVFASTL